MPSLCLYIHYPKPTIFQVKKKIMVLKLKGWNAEKTKKVEKAEKEKKAQGHFPASHVLFLIAGPN